MKGWIYIFTNRSMPDLVKIGYTDRDPSIRVAEQHSGLPYPHDLEYEILVNNAYQIEKKIHKKLRNYNESKEWFRIEVQEAVSFIKDIVGNEIQLENYYKADRLKVEKLQLERNEKLRIEAEERTEQERKKRLFESMRDKIIKDYQIKLDLVKYEEPKTPFYFYLLILPIGLIGALFSFFLIIYIPSISGEYEVHMFFLGLFGIIVWSKFQIKSSEEKKEQARTTSPRYNELIKERDIEIERAKTKIYS